MIQHKYNKQNNTFFLGFDSSEINLVFILLQDSFYLIYFSFTLSIKDIPSVQYSPPQ